MKGRKQQQWFIFLNGDFINSKKAQYMQKQNKGNKRQKTTSPEGLQKKKTNKH